MMDFIKYKIEKGDTLETIAEKFNKTVNELLNFHNSNSVLTQQINSEHIPIHIDTILINSNYEKLKNIHAYRIISENEYFNFKNLVYSTINEITIEIEKLADHKYFLSQKSKVVKCSSPHYDNYLVLLSLLDQPFEDIVLITDDSGRIRSIENQNEIKERWNIVKKNLAESTDDKEMVNRLIKDGDSVYTNSLRHILANIQYNLLYPGNFNLNNVGKISEGFSTKLYSSLFSGSKVLLTFKNRVVEKNGDTVIAENKSFLEKENIKILGELYNVSYRELLGPNFNYNFSLNSNYNLKDNIIVNCTADFIENINDTIVAKSRYQINKI